MREFRYRYGSENLVILGDWITEELDNDQAVMQRIAELHIDALESGKDLRTVYIRTTLKEAPE